MTVTERDSPTRRCRTSECENFAHEIVTLDAEGGVSGTYYASPWCVGCSARLHAEMDAEDKARASAVLLRENGIPPNMADWSIRTYPTRDANGHAAYTAAREWLEGYREGVRRNLYLHGAVGVGKTGLAVSIVRRLCEEATPSYFTVWRDLLADLRESFNNPGAAPSAVSRARDAAVLALDDLGAERPSSFALEELAGLVQRRTDMRRPTVVTSNYTPEALLRYFGDDLTAGRILDRLMDEAEIVNVSGGSRRRGIFGKRGAAS